MAYILYIPSAFSNWYPFAFLQCLSNLRKERQNLRTTTAATLIKRMSFSSTFLYQNFCWQLKREHLDIKMPQIFFSSWTVIPYCCFTPKGSWQSGLPSLASQVHWSCSHHRQYHYSDFSQQLTKTWWKRLPAPS